MTDAELADRIQYDRAWLTEVEWAQVIAALRRQPPSDQALVLKSFAKNRCHACGWPLSGSAAQGCTPFNCSYRPREESPDHDSWLKRAHEMARVLAAAEAEGRKS